MAPARLSATALRALQRRAGNRAVARMLTARRDSAESAPALADADVADVDTAPEGAAVEGAPPEEAALESDDASLDAEAGVDAEPSAEDRSEGDAEVAGILAQLPATPVTLDGEQHQVTLELHGGRAVAGMHSEWTTLEAIEEALAAVAVDAVVTAVLGVAHAAHARLNTAQATMWRAVAARRELRGRRAPPAGGRAAAVGRAVHERRLAAADRRRAEAWGAVRQAALADVAATRAAIDTAWLYHGAHLRLNLMPASMVFAERVPDAGLNPADYHTGSAADPIPIVWYKDPAHYPSIEQTDGTVVPFPGPVQIEVGFDLAVAAANQPGGGGFQLRKVMHNESRAGQAALNQRLNDAGIAVIDVGGRVALNPLSDAGGFDGDHVKDLGFDGADAADNYWPLDAGINRRAFNGYNAGYVVHYQRADGSVGKRSIGGLIGKYFRIKGYMGRGGGDVPAETGTAAAGHS
ncbi:MAG: hypothetical protein AB7F65_02490 [Dehalococcoidia bacterium]